MTNRGEPAGTVRPPRLTTPKTIHDTVPHTSVNVIATDQIGSDNALGCWRFGVGAGGNGCQRFGFSSRGRAVVRGGGGGGTVRRASCVALGAGLGVGVSVIGDNP